MNKRRWIAKKSWWIAALAAIVIATAGWALLADQYDLFFYTSDAGGYTFSTGGGYSLGGTIAQPDAAAMSGSGYSLQGGFWVTVPVPKTDAPAWTQYE